MFWITKLLLLRHSAKHLTLYFPQPLRFPLSTELHFLLLLAFIERANSERNGRERNLVNHQVKVNNIFHSHHHKYIDTFSIKFNYPRRNICVRSRSAARRKTKDANNFSFSIFGEAASAIYLFEYLTRSSHNLSQLANQTFLVWDMRLITFIETFFSPLLVLWFTRNSIALLLWLLLLLDIVSLGSQQKQ